jgi:hypothetical protein
VGAVNEQSEHLSNAQIENYGNQTSGAGPDADREAEQVEAHLQGCSSCRSRLLDFQRTHFALLANPKQPTDQPVNPAPTPDCPDEGDIRQLAAGLLPDAVSDQLTRHAATCDHCGLLLRTYIEDFSDDFSKEEQAVLANLQSSSAAWQKKTAKEMLSAASAGTGASSFAAPAATSTPTATTNAGSSLPSATSSPRRKSSGHPGRKPFLWKWAFVPAATAACTAIAFSIWFTQRDTPEKVEKLLAQAYTEQRTMEMRIPYAVHADISQKRSGGPESILNLPASLRKSAELIDSQLKKNPNDPTWLLLKARLELLEWNYKQALSVLDKIDDSKTLESPEMRTTRALALYQQAELEPERRAQTYGEVINLFGKTLQSAPDDPIALFDRALACEKIYAYECASADFERLLKIDTGSGWSEEAKDHLNRIKEKKTLGR